MKHFGNIVEFTAARNRELMRAYKKALYETKYINIHDICEKVERTPCSRFWISEERASIVVSRMLAGIPLEANILQSRRDMYEEIYRRVVSLKEIHPEMSTSELCCIVVHQPAPRFYMTTRSVIEYIFRIKNGWYDQQYKPKKH